MFVYCDSCKDLTEHVLIKRGKGENVYQCKICGCVTKVADEKEVDVRAVISSGAQSEKGKLTAKLGEVLEVGEERIVETEDGFKVGEITSLEFKNGSRAEYAKVEDVSTVWLRDVGEVVVKISLHKGSITSPYKILVSGDTEFTVGEVLEIGRRKFKITRIKLINGKVLKKEGDTAEAKSIRRIYAMYQYKFRQRSWRGGGRRRERERRKQR